MRQNAGFFLIASCFLMMMISQLTNAQVGTLVGWGMSVCNTFSFKICPTQTIVPLSYGSQGWACNNNINTPDISFNTMGSLWRIAKQNYTFTSNVDGQISGFDPLGNPQTMTFSATQTINPVAYSVNGTTTLVQFGINGTPTTFTFNQANFSISIVPVNFGSQTYTFCNNTAPNVTISPVVPPSGGPWNYTWQPGGLTGNPVTVSPTITTIYTVNAVTSGTGCVSTTTVAVTVTNCCGPMADPSGVSGNTQVCAGSTNIYSVAPVAGATSYSWSLPNGWTGSSLTNTISVVSAIGLGNITVYAINACTVSGISGLLVQGYDCGGNTGLSKTSIAEKGFSIFPNPNNGVFFIARQSSEQATIEVSDVQGRSVLKEKLLLPSQAIELSPGIYILKIKRDSETPLFQRVVVE